MIPIPAAYRNVTTEDRFSGFFIVHSLLSWLSLGLNVNINILQVFSSPVIVTSPQDRNVLQLICPHHFNQSTFLQASRLVFPIKPSYHMVILKQVDKSIQYMEQIFILVQLLAQLQSRSVIFNFKAKMFQLHKRILFGTPLILVFHYLILGGVVELSS